MIIDNRATCKHPYYRFIIDRNEYPTMQDLEELVDSCMNKETYRITIIENDKVIFEKLNEVA